MSVRARQVRAAVHRCALGRFPGRCIRRMFVVRPRLPSGCAPVHQERRVDVFTFVNDAAQYAAMRASFAAAGFGDRATFTALSDADAEPYGAITQVGAAPGAPYAILCHQDITFEDRLTADRLFDALGELERRDPGWVLAGPAGVVEHLEIARRVVDEHGGHSDHPLPAPATSLDELMLVLNRRNAPRCTPGLRGFHLYGTDACLCARTDGGSAWVIDVPVVHTRLDTTRTGASASRYWDAYDRARGALIAAWSPRFSAVILGTPQEVCAIGRMRPLVRFLNRRRILRWVATDRDLDRLRWWGRA